MTPLDASQDASCLRVLYAAEELRKGKAIILSDEEDRENEGDFIFAAEHVSPELVNFMIKEGRGLICLALEPTIVERLQLPLMQDQFKDRDAKNTAFTLSIEARRGVTTGISAADRAQTIRVAVDPSSKPSDLVVPGHIFPIRARPGGVLERAGHTEGSVDLARIAGLSGAAVICEIMNDDGSMARGAELRKIADRFGLAYLTIPDVITYRLARETFVAKIGDREIQTSRGPLQLMGFRNGLDGSEHLVLVRTPSDGRSLESLTVDVRVQHYRPVWDALDLLAGGKARLDQLDAVLWGGDAAVYVLLTRAPGSGLIAGPFLAGCTAGDASSKSTDNASRMDARSIGLGAQILRALGVRRMRVHTSQPAIISDCLALVWRSNRRYL